MSRVSLLLLLVLGLYGQTATNPFDKAPIEVDTALRERIAKFYQAHVDKKPRLAEQYVAEDTKDYSSRLPSRRMFHSTLTGSSIRTSSPRQKRRLLARCLS